MKLNKTNIKGKATFDENQRNAETTIKIVVGGSILTLFLALFLKSCDVVHDDKPEITTTPKPSPTDSNTEFTSTSTNQYIAKTTANGELTSISEVTSVDETTAVTIAPDYTEPVETEPVITVVSTFKEPVVPSQSNLYETTALIETTEFKTDKITEKETTENSESSSESIIESKTIPTARPIEPPSTRTEVTEPDPIETPSSSSEEVTSESDTSGQGFIDDDDQIVVGTDDTIDLNLLAKVLRLK